MSDDDSDDEFDRRSLESFRKAASGFVRALWPERELLVASANRFGEDLNGRVQFMEACGMSGCLRNLVDRPKGGLGLTHVEGVPVLDILQNALALAWRMCQDYTMGLHMLIDYLAEKLTNEEARTLTDDTKATLTSIATARTRHPMWGAVVAPAALAARNRANRGVSFAQVATGSMGHLARHMERMREAPDLLDYMRAHPEATEAEMRAFQDAHSRALMRDSIETIAAVSEERVRREQAAADPTAAAIAAIPTLQACANPRCTALDASMRPDFACGRCRKAAYCSQACQHADWPRHKRVCKV